MDDGNKYQQLFCSAKNTKAVVVVVVVIIESPGAVKLLLLLEIPFATNSNANAFCLSVEKT